MPEPLIIVPGDDDQARGYRIGRWKKMANYECIYCQYSTLWLEKIEKHKAAGEHKWSYPGQNPPEDRDVISTEPEY